MIPKYASAVNLNSVGSVYFTYGFPWCPQEMVGSRYLWPPSSQLDLAVSFLALTVDHASAFVIETFPLVSLAPQFTSPLRNLMERHEKCLDKE